METTTNISTHFSFLVLALLCLIPAVCSMNELQQQSKYNGSITESDDYIEEMMESEISRRFLEQRRYISIGALKRDHPACDGGASGTPYTRSGCLPPPANPYNRGCSKYYRCRSD
ncbi:hypothetical protein Leryth_024501 [Lithospermum erythrorhizon]|nr:hypothetical protein Leryth_024501 [Lithospermum erythrorhizon]